jgi:hypothetical protein
MAHRQQCRDGEADPSALDVPPASRLSTTMATPATS